MSGRRGERGRRGSGDDDYALAWPEPDGTDDAPTGADDFRLGWDTEPEPASAAPASAPAPAPAATPDPAPPRPRVRLRARATRSSSDADVHATCRERIAELEAELSALREELALLQDRLDGS